ncbi:hypothetical protein C8Q80DRAFT_1117491 [Daedaleopsis nitida]|nr:hypothetical protein C8Q80DRAFT_1117491 [Daedaleopsis nitida]
MASNARSVPRRRSMTDAFSLIRDPDAAHTARPDIINMVQEMRQRNSQLDTFATSLPKLIESDLATLGQSDSTCPICLTSLLAILAEEEMAIAMDSPAHPIEELGVTRLVNTCGHIFCRKELSALLPYSASTLTDESLSCRRFAVFAAGCIKAYQPAADASFHSGFLEDEVTRAFETFLRGPDRAGSGGNGDDRTGRNGQSPGEEFPEVQFEYNHDRDEFSGITYTLYVSYPWSLYYMDLVRFMFFQGWQQSASEFTNLVRMYDHQNIGATVYHCDNRSLLNPRFDGYKFSPLEHDEVASRFPLEHKLSQTNVSGRAPLSFQEVQSRVTHNHLAVCSQTNRAVYVDAELRVVGLDLHEDTLKPEFRVLYELPRPIQSSEVETLQKEYPSAAFVDTTSLFVSDGYGTLYALRLGDSGYAELLATYELSIPDAYGSAHRVVPFRLHHAISPDNQAAVVILSSKYYPKDAEPLAKGSKLPPSKFDVWGASIPLPVTHSLASDAQPLQILWHRRGSDVPVYTAYDPPRRSFLFVGSSPYLPNAVAPAQQYEPAADELAPIPRQGENLDGIANGAGAAAGVPKPPPYSWTQTSDSVTIAIPLPADTPKEHIKVAFSPRTLTVLVEGPAASASSGGPTDVPVVAPRFTLRTLWDGIHASTSLWTFDRAAASRYGLLTLHLDKQHEGTRWPQVFSSSAPAAPGSPDTEEEADVPETLDPSELYNIREALEKYTAALAGGADAGGLGSGVPSLAQGERDDEVDLSVGKSACLTWVGADGAPPPSAGQLADDDAPVQVLSTPFPGAAGSFRISIVAKHGIDGATFTLQPPPATDTDMDTDTNANGSDRPPPEWAHTSTFSALAFVLASKRDTRFVHHVASRAVFTFESGARDLGGNVYVYRGAGPKENWAKQAILKIGGGAAGALLGVGLMRVQGRVVVLCLCEGELVVLHGVL